MNKAFVREPDPVGDCCPRCGSLGQPVGREVLQRFLPEDKMALLAEPASFCPAPRCKVAYFDAVGSFVATPDLKRPVYPKDPTAPICECFGLTREDIEQDVREGVVTRVRAILQKAESAEARCSHMAANGCSCAAHVQKYYMQCRSAKS